MGMLPFCLLLSLCVGHAALDYELVLVIHAVGVHKGLRSKSVLPFPVTSISFRGSSQAS